MLILKIRATDQEIAKTLAACKMDFDWTRSGEYCHVHGSVPNLEEARHEIMANLTSKLWTQEFERDNDEPPADIESWPRPWSDSDIPLTVLYVVCLALVAFALISNPSTAVILALGL